MVLMIFILSEEILLGTWPKYVIYVVFCLIYLACFLLFLFNFVIYIYVVVINEGIILVLYLISMSGLLT